MKDGQPRPLRRLDQLRKKAFRAEESENEDRESEAPHLVPKGGADRLPWKNRAAQGSNRDHTRLGPNGTPRIAAVAIPSFFLQDSRAMLSRRLATLFILLSLAPLCASAMQLTSPSFSDGQPLPRLCGHRYDNRNPEILLSGIPTGARSLALILDDPDAPGGCFVHWLVWNLPPSTSKLLPGKLPREARTGRNHFGNDRYDGPAPPSGTHRYFFRLFALDEPLGVPAGADRRALEKAMKGHVLAEASLMGTFAADR